VPGSTIIPNLLSGTLRNAQPAVYGTMKTWILLVGAGMALGCVSGSE